MKKHNYYKDVVLCLIIILLMAAVQTKIKQCQKEQKRYHFTAASQTAWTKRDVAQLKKLNGILKFEPVASVNAVIKLGCYTLETELKGICLEEYPIRLQSSEHTYDLGNTPLLFIGKDCLASFADAHGNAPAKSELDSWTQNYQTLTLTITDDAGNEKSARIGGILKEPCGSVCMEQTQMQAIWGRDIKMNEGYIEIQGYQNMKHAKEVLEGCGIACN